MKMDVECKNWGWAGRIMCCGGMCVGGWLQLKLMGWWWTGEDDKLRIFGHMTHGGTNRKHIPIISPFSLLGSETYLSDDVSLCWMSSLGLKAKTDSKHKSSSWFQHVPLKHLLAKSKATLSGPGDCEWWFARVEPGTFKAQRNLSA